MYDHIKNGQLISGPHAIGAPYVRKVTRCGTPEVLLTNGIIDLGELGKIVPRSYPTLTATQKYSGTVIVGENATSMEVVSKTAEELAAERQANCNAIFDAAESYVDCKGDVSGSKGRISKYSIGVITLKGASNKPKSKSNQDWVNSVFALAYQREAQINSGAPFTDAMLDFSSCGEMPHTIAECLQEA